MNPTRSIVYIALVVVTLQLPAQAQYAAYNTKDFTIPDWTHQTPRDIVGTQMVGWGAGNSSTNGVQHGLLWAGNAGLTYDLQPTSVYSESGVNATNGMRQAGYGTIFFPATVHALLWTWNPSGPQTFVNLHPAGATSSLLLGISRGGTEQQVGKAAIGGFDHAMLWTGTAQSFVDLHPAGYTDSYANGTNGAQQLGGAHDAGNVNHAMLWSGTAASFVDLTPAGFAPSFAFDIAGAQQVGQAFNGTANHAILWTGTAASKVDLHPAGYEHSGANGTNGSKQVGTAADAQSSLGHAALWSGSAASFVDLHSLVPNSPSQTVANAIDVYGNIAGYAIGAGNQNHAIVWWAGDAWLGNLGWNETADWSGGAVPTAGHDVLVIPTTPQNKLLNYPTGAMPSFGKLVVDNPGGGNVTLAVPTGSSVATTSTTIGLIGVGIVNNMDANHTVSNTLELGTRPGGHGTYTLTSASSLTAGREVIGNQGSGVFTQIGGSNTVNLQVDVGFAPGGAGEFVLNGGTLEISGPLGVGFSGAGSFAQIGGFVSVGSNLRIGPQLTGNGSYYLSSDGVVEAATCHLGGTGLLPGGTGRLDISSGTMTVSGLLKIWNTTNTALNLSGGTLNVGSLDTNGNPTRLNWTGGTLNIGNGSGPFVIGPGGPLGPSVSVNSSQSLTTTTANIDSGGQIVVAGGNLAAANIIDNGTLTMTSGTLNATVLGAGNDGTLTGGAGTGNIFLSGGSVQTGAVLLGSNAGGSGDMTVSGTGDLTTDRLAGNDFIVNDGTVTVLDQAGNPPDPVLDRSMVAGYVHDGALIVNGGTVTTPRIKLGVTQGKTGTYTQTGGTLNVEVLAIANTADEFPNSGVGIADISSGTLTAGTVYVGNPGVGAGTLRWSGGTLHAQTLVMAGDCTLSVGLAGATLGSGYSQLQIASDAKLAGPLEVIVADGFEPALGQAFVIMTFASSTGTFESVTGMDPGPGKAFHIQHNATNVTLIVVPAVPGDMNCDNVQDTADIAPFVLALTNPAAYQQQFPNCDPIIGDMNFDLVLDGRDIGPFAACLLNGGCQ